MLDKTVHKQHHVSILTTAPNSVTIVSVLNCVVNSHHIQALCGLRIEQGPYEPYGASFRRAVEVR